MFLDEYSRGKRKHKKKNANKKKRKKIILYITIPILVLFLAVGGYVLALYFKASDTIGKSYEDDGRDKSNLRETIVDPTKDNISILIIGVDSSEKRANMGTPRSDTLMLATLNKKENSVKLLSIPRDSYVYIPEVDYETKINHAHRYGGPKASIETVEHLLDIPVDYYVSVNFEAFMDIVNALGGITVEVPYEMWEQDSKDRKDAIHLLPGVQVLNGEEALAFARTRHYDSDMKRGQRQMEVIKAIVKKATSIGSVLKYGDIIEAIGENMKTNLTFAEMQGLISYGLSGKTLDIESLQLKGDDWWPNGTYYYKLDEEALEETKQLLKEHLELVPSNEPDVSTN